MDKYKLYVWEHLDVCAYTSDIGFALALNKQQAINKIAENLQTHGFKDNYIESRIIEMRGKEPLIFTEPTGYYKQGEE